MNRPGRPCVDTAMRAAAVLVVCLAAAPAAADRNSDFSAELIGADPDTLGVILVHDASARGWSMKVRPRPGADQRVIAVPEIDGAHGDYLVFVGPGRTRIAWVLVAGPHGVPEATDPFVWIYDPAAGLVKTVTFGEAFSADERDKMAWSITTMSWLGESLPKVKRAKLTLPARWGKPVVVDLARDDVARKRR